MLKKLFSATLWMLLLFPVAGALAQTATVTGTVTDSTNGDPLPGVNVVVQGTQLGAATGPGGTYTINGVPTGQQTLVASFVGFDRREVPVTISDGNNEVNISLISSTVGLDDVVVTALGIERQERSLGYAVDEIEAEELDRTGVTNFVGNLSGKVAGAQISTSSEMGGSARIVLRGPGSVTGDNEPLIVVDGVPLDNSNFASSSQASGRGGYDYGNAASIINPADVESVSVLKGPSAAALYGSRAANGAILITTKSGGGARQGGAIGVTVQTGVTFTEIYNFADYQNAYGGGSWSPFQMNEEGQLVADFSTDQSWGPPLDGREVRQWYSYDDVNGLMGQTTPWVAHPDNIENFFQRGSTINTNVAFSQGGDNFNYRASVNNITETGTSAGSQLGRNTVSFKGNLDLTDRLTTSISANYIQEDAERRVGAGYDGAVSPWQQFNTFGQRQIDLSEDAPMRSLRRPDGTQRSWNWLGVQGAINGDIIYANNPFWTIQENFPTDDLERVYGNFRVSYDFLDNLTAAADVRTDYYTNRREERIAVGSVEQPQYVEDFREVQETNSSLELTYTGDLRDDLSLEAYGGANYRYSNYSANLANTEGGLSTAGLYTLENSISRPSIEDYFQEQGLFGLYADVTLGYQDFLYIGGSLRNDWSSTLPEGNNSYLYPSVRGSFVFSSLPALQNADFLSFGKVRANWSQVGRDTDPYRLAFVYPGSTPFNGRSLQSLPNSLNNEDLKPEITTGWEVGLQLQFLNNRLGLDATYYTQNTRNQIISVSRSSASGFSGQVLNAGEIGNRGVELALNLTPVLTDRLRWDFTVNWATNENEVVSLAEGIEQVTVPLGVPPFGPRVVARVGEPYGAFFGNGFRRDENGNKVLNANGTYALEGGQVLGSYQPDWTGGVSTTLSYGGITGSVLVDGQKGGQIWSLTNLFGLYSGIVEETVEGDIRELGLVPQGVLADGSTFEGRVDPNFFFTRIFGNHELNLYDASYAKLREASLGYTIPARWLTSIPALQGLTVSAIGRNLATLYKKSPNFDPSAVTLSATNAQGFEVGQLPPTRAYGFRLRASF